MDPYVTIYLPLGEFKTTVDRQKLLTKYPDSLLATMLEQDPQATVIELTQPFVTYRVLSQMTWIINDDRVPYMYPDEVDPINFEKSSRYLLMDILGVIGTPEYVQFQDKFIYPGEDYWTGNDLLHLNISLDLFKQYMSFCLDKCANKLGQYIIQHSTITC